MTEEGVDIVYNDFYIEDGADVTIIAGCGIHGEGCSETRHDGIHARVPPSGRIVCVPRAGQKGGFTPNVNNM